MSTTFFGWDLLYSSVQKDVKNNQDILVCFAHLVLVSNGFKCIGLGKSEIIDGSQRREVLPKGWNTNYTMKYVYEDHLYNFKAISLDGGVMLNLETADKKKVSLVQLKTNSVVKKIGELEVMIPNYRNILDVIRKQLIEKVVGFRRFREISSQTSMEPTVLFPSLNKSRGPLFDALGDDVKLLYKDYTTHLKI